MLKEELNKFVDAYDADPSENTKNAIEDFLRKHTIYFRKSYDNSEGMKPSVANNFQESGRFLRFTESTQFQIPSLLTIQKDDGSVVYVALNDFTFE